MKIRYTLFLLLVLGLSALFSPAIFGAELGGKIAMSEPIIMDSVLPAGNQEFSDHATVNANYEFKINKETGDHNLIINDGQIALARIPFTNKKTTTFSGVDYTANHKGAAVLTNKAEFTGYSSLVAQT